MTKPIKAKPAFYALCYVKLQAIARQMGYNLLLHGSMDRDMDLICVAWIDNPRPHIEVLDAFSDYLGVHKEFQGQYLLKMLPANRSSYVININRGGIFNQFYDEQMYLDISFTPF